MLSCHESSMTRTALRGMRNEAIYLLVGLRRHARAAHGVQAEKGEATRRGGRARGPPVVRALGPFSYSIILSVSIF